MPGSYKKNDRADHSGTHRSQFDKNKRKIYATQSICGICGRPVDKTLAYPDPMSKTIDHIIPISKGGHPSDLDNLQLAHLICNRQKSNRLIPGEGSSEKVESWLGIDNLWEIKHIQGGKTIPKAELLYQRIDKKKIEEEVNKLKANTGVTATASVEDPESSSG